MSREPTQRRTFAVAQEKSSDRFLMGQFWAVCCLILILLFGSGCHSLKQWYHNGFKVGPNHCTPPATVTDVWMESDDDRVSLDGSDFSQWWSVFDDPVLDGLILNAYQQNLTLREAGFRVLQAQAERAIARGEKLPQVQQVTGDYTRLQTSDNILSVLGGIKAIDQWNLGFNVAWELDVWGRFRRLVEAADAELDASVNSYDAILNTLIAEVAQTYIEIRLYQEQLRVTRENILIQEESLGIAESQLQLGTTDQVSVDLAVANLEITRAAEPGQEIALRTAANRLCVLLGVPPQQLGPIIGIQPIPTVPNEVAVGIPADLIRRRPDIRAEERLVAARCAEIGIAEAELFPSFFIDGTLRVSSRRLDDLFTSESVGGSIGPAFQWNVLNYGRLINNVRASDAVLEQAIASYQQTVLEAGEEVENGLTSFLRSQSQFESFNRSVEANLRALELVRFQFREGEISFTPIYVLQGNIANQQLELAEAKAAISLNLINLYRALGGGWQLRCYVDPQCGLITEGFQGLAPPTSGPTQRLDGKTIPEDQTPIEAPALEAIEGLSDAELRVIATELLKRLASDPAEAQTKESVVETKPVIQAAKPAIQKTVSKKPQVSKKRGNPKTKATSKATTTKVTTKTASTETKDRNAAKANTQKKAQQKPASDFAFSTKISRNASQPRTAWQVNEALKSAMNRYRKDSESNALR